MWMRRWARTLAEYLGVVEERPTYIHVPGGSSYVDNGALDYGREHVYRDETGLQIVLPHTLVKFIQEQRSEQQHG